MHPRLVLVQVKFEPSCMLLLIIFFLGGYEGVGRVEVGRLVLDKCGHADMHAPVCGHERGTVIGEGEREMQTSH